MKSRYPEPVRRMFWWSPVQQTWIEWTRGQRPEFVKLARTHGLCLAFVYES